MNAPSRENTHDRQAAKTFTLFFGQLLLLVDQLRPNAFPVKYHLWQAIAPLGLPDETQKALADFLLKKHNSLPLLALSGTQLRQVFQACYNILCEEFGPVEADALVGRIAARVDASPAGRVSSCRQWM